MRKGPITSEWFIGAGTLKEDNNRSERKKEREKQERDYFFFLFISHAFFLTS